MNNILTKPYTDKDYADFAVLANANGQRTEQDDSAVYALYTYEQLQNGEIVDISGTQEYKDKIALEKKTEFFKNFIKTSKGCIRLETKVGPFIAILPSYALEVMATGKLQAGRILFYDEPDFENLSVELTTRDSLEMTATQFQVLQAEIMAEYIKIFKS